MIWSKYGLKVFWRAEGKTLAGILCVLKFLFLQNKGHRSVYTVHKTEKNGASWCAELSNRPKWITILLHEMKRLPDDGPYTLTLDLAHLMVKNFCYTQKKLELFSPEKSVFGYSRKKSKFLPLSLTCTNW